MRTVDMTIITLTAAIVFGVCFYGYYTEDKKPPSKETTDIYIPDKNDIVKVGSTFCVFGYVRAMKDEKIELNNENTKRGMKYCKDKAYRMVFGKGGK